MELIHLIAIGGTLLAIGAFLFRKNLFVEVKDPNAGLLYQLNQLSEGTVIPPGTHFIPQNIGPIWINRVVVMPGREFIIDIHSDTALSQNVPVLIDIKLTMQLQLDDIGIPTFDSMATLVRWLHLATGETLFPTIVNGELVPGKLSERLTSIVNDAISKVIIRYSPSTITSDSTVYDELLSAIYGKIWKQISPWAGKLIVEIEHIEVSDEVNRTRIKLDADAQAHAFITEEQAQFEMDKRYKEAFGDSAAFVRITGRSFKGSSFNVFSDGIGGLLRTLGTVNSEVPPNITARQPRRIVRRKKQ